MSITQERLKKIIADHKESLEQFGHYRDTIGETDESKTVADTIMDCGFDSEDFNVGFEQGFITGLESLLE